MAAKQHLKSDYDWSNASIQDPMLGIQVRDLIAKKEETHTNVDLLPTQISSESNHHTAGLVQKRSRHLNAAVGCSTLCHRLTLRLRWIGRGTWSHSAPRLVKEREFQFAFARPSRPRQDAPAQAKIANRLIHGEEVIH